MAQNASGIHELVEQFHQAREELTHRLRAGEPCSAAEYLRALPALAAHQELALELICSEYAARRDLGQCPSLAEWCGRFPAWQDALQARLSRDTPPQTNPNQAATVAGETVPQAGIAPERAMGRRFGRYLLLEEIGRGGMGVVYKAHDTRLDRVVALKMVRGGVLSGQQEIERFHREAKAAAKLEHPHIIKIHDSGAIDGEPFITMAYVEGSNLAQRMGAAFCEPAEAVALVEKLARALDFAHDRGVIHRDLKPSNVLLDDQQEPRIGDFGLAKLLNDDPELTRDGQLLGTPLYMAPEQAQGRGDQTTPRSDIWSLGVMLYELLTGQRPFSGKSSQELTHNILTADPPRPRTVGGLLDASLETIVLKCLEKDPARRYASAADLADDLAHWRRGEPIMARPEGRARRAWRFLRSHPFQSAAALLVALAVVGVPLASSYADPERSLRQIEHALRRGETVQLIGARGGPRRGLPILGIPEFNPNATDDKPFLLGSKDLCLYELLTDPQLTRYRFSADVRHEVGDHGNRVGLYFCRSRHQTVRGTEECFGVLVFDDLVPSQVSEIDNQKALKMRADVCAVEFRMDVTASRDPGIMGPPLQGVLYPPRGRTQEWRRLAVEVRPDTITAFWDGAPLGRPMTRKEIHKWNQEIYYLRPGLAPEYPARGGLGLFVRDGRASFRNVMIEPLP